MDEDSFAWIRARSLRVGALKHTIISRVRMSAPRWQGFASSAPWHGRASLVSLDVDRIHATIRHPAATIRRHLMPGKSIKITSRAGGAFDSCLSLPAGDGRVPAIVLAAAILTPMAPDSASDGSLASALGCLA
jgi:hypothetical protein